MEQTYKIRRNSKGKIMAIDVIDLLNAGVDNNVLMGVKNDWIATYRQASSNDPVNYPEGWYRTSYNEALQDLMENEKAFHLLLDALTQKNVLFQPSLSDETYSFLKDFLG